MLAAKCFVQFGNIIFTGATAVSRIGKKIIEVPDKVQLTFDGMNLKAKGPKGQLEYMIPDGLSYKLEDKILTFERENDSKPLRSLHGLARSLAFNAIEGVTNGFSKTLKIEGVGYKAELKNSRLFLSLGFSHPILIIPPDGVSFELPNPTTVIISGIEKQIVGEVSAKIRKLRPPEPYKGKGVRYEGEYVRRKAGKTATK